VFIHTIVINLLVLSDAYLFYLMYKNNGILIRFFSITTNIVLCSIDRVNDTDIDKVALKIWTHQLLLHQNIVLMYQNYWMRQWIVMNPWNVWNITIKSACHQYDQNVLFWQNVYVLLWSFFSCWLSILWKSRTIYYCSAAIKRYMFWMLLYTYSFWYSSRYLQKVDFDQKKMISIVFVL